jgi:hypothetical protein
MPYQNYRSWLDIDLTSANPRIMGLYCNLIVINLSDLLINLKVVCLFVSDTIY